MTHGGKVGTYRGVVETNKEWHTHRALAVRRELLHEAGKQCGLSRALLTHEKQRCGARVTHKGVQGRELALPAHKEASLVGHELLRVSRLYGKCIVVGELIVWEIPSALREGKQGEEDMPLNGCEEVALDVVGKDLRGGVVVSHRESALS